MTTLDEGNNVVIIKSNKEHMIGKKAVISEILDNGECFICIGMRKRRFRIPLSNLKVMVHPAFSKTIK